MSVQENTWLSPMVGIFLQFNVGIFLCQSCDISHVALGGGATARYEQRLWRNMPLTFDVMYVLHF